MDALCVDIDPLCTLMTRAKTHPVDTEVFRDLRDEILRELGDLPDEEDIDEDNAKALVESNLEGLQYCVPYNLNHWFEPYVSVGFSRLLATTNDYLQTESDEMADAFHTSLAAMVRQISRADPEPVSGLEVTKIRKQQLENGVEFNVARSFRQVTSRLANGYDELHELDHELGEVTVVEGDAREFEKICEEHNYEPAVVVTSPPYCNAIEYSRRHRLEYEWLGLFNKNDAESQRAERLDTSREFFGSVTPTQDMLEGLDPVGHDELASVLEDVARDGKDRKANLLRKYFLDARMWLTEIRNSLVGDGYLYLIVGPSTSYGHPIDTPRYLGDIASNDLGFILESEQRYKYKNNKMQYPTEGETTELEAIVKLRS